jgi:hypothetical protein
MKTLQEIYFKEDIEFQGANWELHPDGARFFRKLMDVVDWFSYDPRTFRPENPGDRNLGGWNPKQKQAAPVLFNTQEKIFYIKSRLTDPRIAVALRSTLENIPEAGEYLVKDWYDEDKDYGRLANFVEKIKKVSGKYKEYTDEDEPTYKEFELEVFEDLSDKTWYHATREKNLDSIRQKGLLSSGEFDQGEGWTQLNLNLQDAVYLTADKKYAEGIAESLVAKYHPEAAIIIEVDGSVLKDYSKLVVDEDSIRNDYDGAVSSGNLVWELPHYLSSVVDNIESVGYEGTISPKYLKPIERIWWDEEDEELYTEKI